MPPETFSWERFKERPPSDSVGPGSRWRDPPFPNGFRTRPPSVGNGQQGPWHYNSAESGHGFASPRVNDRFIGNEGFRPSGYRMDGRCNRFDRDNKGPFGHRDMRGNSWENDMSNNSSGRLRRESDQRSIDERGSFGQRNIKDHCWENGRLQNGSDQRLFDERSSFGRRNLRGKSWENGVFPDSSGRLNYRNDQYSFDDRVPFEKKNLKRRSPENGVLPNSFCRLNVPNEQRVLYDKGSSAQNYLKEKFCENGVFLNSSCKFHTVGDQSSLDEKDIKGQYMENGALPTISERLHSCNNQRLADDLLTFTSPIHSEHSKDQFDKSNGASDLAPDRKMEKESSLRSIDWKPLKWTRSGSFSSRGRKTEMSPVNATPLRSPSGDSTAFPTVSVVLSDEAVSRKKPRLGWGEGLAKFEKKKVEGPDDDSASKPGLVICVTEEPSHVVNFADKSPRLSGFLDCASPATPSSVACSSSPGVVDKACIRPANIEYDASLSTGSPNLLLQEHTEVNQERDFCSANLERSSVANLNSSLKDPATVESNFERSTAMNKLLVLRDETMKALEVTESEIDSLENDLKKLVSEPTSNCPLQETSSSVLEDCQEQPCEDKDLDTPAYKLLEPLSDVNGDASSDSVKNDKGCDSMEVIVLENIEKFPVYEYSNGNIERLSSLKGSDHSAVAFSCDSEEALSDQILALNKDIAIKADEVFDKLLSLDDFSLRTSRTSSVSRWKDNPQIMEKFAFKKHCRRFEERVITLKYRALQYLWKEHLQLTSLKKNRSKSHKRIELSSRGLHGSIQKHRLSLRSSSSNAAGNLSLVPTAGVINFTRKLLSVSQIKPCRNYLKMPALIIGEKERIVSQFISNNGLVEDPCAVEKERAMINPWTEEERKIFMDKFATFGKNFNMISSFLDHKTTADCVEFYYKNHKSDCFVKPKKKLDFPKQGKAYSFSNYLVGSGKTWNSEKKAASLDVLSEASAIAAKSDLAMQTLKETSGSKDAKTDGLLEKYLNVSVNERETEAADVLVGICGSISPDLGESHKNLTNRKVATDDDDDSCSDDSHGEVDSADWTDEEKSIFLQAFASYGKNFTIISRRVGTKSRDQCNVFFSKVKKCFGLDKVRPRLCVEGEDDNVGGSDNEGACVLEPEKSSSRGDKNVLLSDMDVNDLEKNNGKDPNESENIITDESKPVIDLEGEGKMENSVDTEHMIVVNPTITVLHSDIEEDRCNGEALSLAASVSDDVANDHGFSNLSAEVGTVEPTLYSGDLRTEELETVSEIDLNVREVDNSSNDRQEAAGNRLRDLNFVDQDFNESDNAPDVAGGGFDADVDFEGNIKQDQKINIDLSPPCRSLDISLIGNHCPVSAQDDFERTSEKLYKKSRTVDTCTQNQSNSSVLVGYPLHLAISQEMNSKYLPDMYPSQGGVLWKCNNSDTPSSAVDFQFQSHEQRKAHSRHHSWSSSDSGKPKSNGDVILFGQILKSQPNRSISNSTLGDINQKNSGTNNVDLNSVGKFERKNYLGLENIPTGSFGFLNGNTVPLGFPSSLDSAILLAKYPSAFGNLSSLSSNSDITSFPSRGMKSGSRVVDSHLHMNQQELPSDMPRRNGSGVSNLRNPMGFGKNVGISDPVTAMQMHFAKMERYGSGPPTNNLER